MKVVGIIWDTDGYSAEELGLPLIVNVPDPIDVGDISDWLSDEYGYCVDSFICMDEVDWEAVLEEQQSLLRATMLMDMQWTLNGADSSPYTFQIFDLQERIGCIEKKDYGQAYLLLAEEYGEEYFGDFLMD